MADGHITSCRYPHIQLNVSTRDKEILDKYRKFIGPDHPIYYGKAKLKNGKVYHNCRVFVFSNELVERVARYGVLPRKTGTERVNYLETCRHFWRGCLDGDGCLGTYVFKKYGKSIPCIALVGSKFLLEQFADFCSTCMPDGYRPIVRKVKDVKLHRMELKGGRAVIIAKKLYEDCTIYLERKYQKAQKMLSEFPASLNTYWERNNENLLDELRLKIINSDMEIKEIARTSKVHSSLLHRFVFRNGRLRLANYKRTLAVFSDN